MSDPLGAPLPGILKMTAGGPLLACHYPANGPIIVVELLRSDPPEGPPDHDAPQRAFTYLKYQLGKGDSDPITITNGFWPISGSTDALCIVTAV
jgi:hypothetical protein